MENPHWAELKPLPHTAQNRCFGCGPANPQGLRLDFYTTNDDSVVTMPTMADCYEGPPGHVHGGIIATLLDETMSKAVRMHGVLAVTRHLEIDYLRPIPSTTKIRIEAKRSHVDGRKQFVEGKIFNADGVVMARGKALFIEVQPL